jgi:flagellar motor component MotA
MTNIEFENRYFDIAYRALECVKNCRKEGLLALEEAIDHEKKNERDIFEYGLQFVLDGVDHELIDKILSNIIQQEKDKDMYTLKMIQKEAVLSIQEGTNSYMMCALLNSYTDLTLTKDPIIALEASKNK